MAVVLDASFIVAIALDEDPPAVADVRELMAREGAVVPSLWRFEVANGLVMAARRGRITSSSPAAILRRLEALTVEVDKQASALAWTTTLGLAQRHGLTVYDAAYLELALRLEAGLASLDKDLTAAARREHVVVVGA